jgi:hypothetical protein
MKIVKALKTTLYAPLSSSDTSLILKRFVDLDGNELAMSDFGDWGVVVLKSGDVVEMIKFSGLSQSSTDTTCTLTVATTGRSIAGTSPYAGASTGEDFNAGAEAIISNDPLTLSRFANLDVAGTFTEIMTFSALPQTTAGNPVVANDLTRKAYVDSVVAGIATTINVIVPGVGGETITAGQLVYFDDTDNEWKLCDADTAGTVENVMLGVAQGAGSNGVAIVGGVLVRGLDANQTGLTAGAIYYASNTPGALSATPGTKEVTFGFAYSTTEFYFNPRFNQQLTEDQQDALAGTSGTPSTTNPYATKATTDLAEVLTNKDTTVTLGTSDTLYPSQKAVKTYADAQDVKTCYLTASDTLQQSANTERTNNNGTPTLLKSIRIHHTGTIRVKFDAKSTTSTADGATFRVYKNGSTHGTQQTTTSGDPYTTFSEDLTFSAGDYIQVYAWVAGTTIAYVQNFRIYYTQTLGLDNAVITD